MKIVVLLSAGRDPHSGAARPVPVELQAIALAQRFAGAAVSGLHAGAADASVLDALGHGLGALTLLRLDPCDDPLAALAAEMGRVRPDLILAGRRGRGGNDGGLLPYRLALACGMPIVADAMGIAIEGNALAVVQALPRGARRRVSLALPAVVTVHEAAPPAQSFVYRARRSGVVEERQAARAPAVVTTPDEGFEIVAYRQRPKLIGDAAPASAAGRLMVAPTAEDAAAAVLAYVERFRTPHMP